MLNLSPLNQRRWSNFKANRRGFFSLWIFLVLFGLSLIAEVLVNDRPVLVRYNGELLSPVLVDYPEEKFGGFLATTDYHDPIIQEEIEANGWMLWPPIRYSFSTINRSLPTEAPSPPWWLLDRETLCEPFENGLEDRNCTIGNFHWLGTDDTGRDMVARLVYGFRISVWFGLILTISASIIGVAAGAFQGFYGGWVDLIGQRLIEVWSSVPALYVIIIIAAIFEPTFWILLFILLAFSWTALTGVVRAEFLRGRNFDYIQAARALGVNNHVIMWRHLLPNAMVATLTFAPFLLNGAITTLTSLDFLGFGMPPGSASLGEVLQQGRKNYNDPWIGISGFFAIAVTLSLLIFIGEAVRDALDPRKTFN